MDRTDFVGGRSSRASKRTTPMPDGVGSSDEYSDSDWEEEKGRKNDSLKSRVDESVTNIQTTDF